MSEQLHSELLASSPSEPQLAAWRVFFEAALACLDVLDTELQRERGIPIRWYDVLVHLEEAEDGLPMNELAGRLLASKSGLTRVVDRMEAAGLVRRERPPADRRVVKVQLTPAGVDELHASRVVHRRGIQEHFAQHLDERDAKALARALERVRAHVRPLRPGRVS